MLFISSPSHYAPFNLASEEYILDSFADDVFLLYINAPSIIVGCHQNTLAEINHEYVKEHSIPVVRRLTGGGTVFHDLGNLNFSFIVRDDADHIRSFAKYTAPVLAALRDLGVDARLEGRNDLTIGGLKFSGNAKASIRGKTIQHGTILFSSRIADLSQALKANPLKFNDKAVKSVRARVTNVSDHLRHPISLEEFILLIHKQVRLLYPEAGDYAFSRQDEEAIRALVDAKYDTWDWNFGSSPDYGHSHAIRTAAGTIEIHADVQGGVITGLRVYGDFFGNRDTREFEQRMLGTPHEEKAILELLGGLPLDDYFGDVSPDELVRGFF
jgi:lipoate-protein ligase A